MSESPAASTAAVRVSTLELFFDLVFVFTITQLAAALAEDLTLATLGNVMLILGLVWWMYAGYAWLTNAVAPSSTLRRTLLLTGMGGFLLMALAIPGAFDEYGWLFGASYLMVILAHTVLFLQAGPAAVVAMRRLGPLNIGSALLVLIGGVLPEEFRHPCWLAALALMIASPYLHRLELHMVNAGHFVERHGLVVIVAIGESIVSIGAGFAGVHLDGGAILVALLGLTIAYYLWWIYFAGDDARSERVLAGMADPMRRARLAIRGWGYAHYPMLLGIVVLSVGIKKTVGHAFEGLRWEYAIALAGGVALYQLSHAWFVGMLGLSGWPHRVIAALAVLATIPLGHQVAIAQLAAIPFIMVVAAITEDLPRVHRAGGSTAFSEFGRTASTPE
jgi:low temperature requirement protein LtrA